MMRGRDDLDPVVFGPRLVKGFFTCTVCSQMILWTRVRHANAELGDGYWEHGNPPADNHEAVQGEWKLDEYSQVPP